MPVAVHIIEDDPSVRDAARELIASQGRRVHIYKDPEDFRASSTLGPRDIVILDIHFAMGSGVEIGLDLRRRQPGVRIIVISGLRGPDYERGLRAIAPDASFRKPLDGSALAECVARLADST
jgi:FixJ family two-component response regulator